ncbi:MAG: zincin-like metallopeptidase domain-containing protein [Hyphomonadaceae bacterium JAD_PAG50586_4]|nr:MAG: zincin-like metallopeptidase domain-containing protein [Hyphomonadaceae bacterium JAD_PAG50586_4]
MLKPATDTIHLPPRPAFVSLAQYFSTRLHECAHWSGHPTRLARDAFVGPRSVTAYAREELIAELTSAFLGAELGLPVDHLEDHASYIDHWLKILDREPGALLTAAGHAQRAADFLRPFLGLTPDSAVPDTVAPDTTDTQDTLHTIADRAP